MALTGWPTEASEGQVATELRWRKMARLWAIEGVAAGVLNDLTPSLDAGQVTIQPGAAWIDGHYAENDTPAVVPVSGDGMVVLRYTYAGSVFAFAFAAGQTTPVQSATQYEIPLATIASNVLTDRRVLVAQTQVPGRGRWERTTAQTIATGATTTVTYTGPVRVDDPAGDFTMNLGTGALTINRAGWYRVAAGVAWTFLHTGAITAGTHDVSLIVVTGGSAVISQHGYFNSYGLRLSLAAVIYLPAGATVVAQVRQVSGTNRTLDGIPSTYFSVERV